MAASDASDCMPTAVGQSSAVQQGTGDQQGLDSEVVLKKILPVAGGSFVEWYEFAMYTYMSSYISVNFFGGGHWGAQVWAGFAVTSAFRPFGGAFFGYIADAFGRKPALQLTISVMMITTALIGCLPTLHCCGHAWGRFGLLMLLFLRALQDLSAGGELSTAAVYIAEVSPHRSLGYNLSWISVTGSFGAWIVAALVLFIFESILSREDMYAWGWRLPYLTSLIPGGVLVLYRKSLAETDDYKQALIEAAFKRSKILKEVALKKTLRERPSLEDGAPHSADGDSELPAATGTKQLSQSYGDSGLCQDVGPLRQLLLEHKLAVLIGSLGCAGVGSFWYLLPLCYLQLVQRTDGISENMATLVQVLVNIIPAVLAPFAGMLADTIGVFKVHIATIVIGGLFMPAPLLYWWMHASHRHATLAVLLGSLIVGLVSACTTAVYLWVVELFPARVRATGVSVAFNIGIGVFGCAGPVILELGDKAISPTGPLSAPAAYMLLVNLLALAAVIASQVLARTGSMRLTHIRSIPY